METCSYIALGQNIFWTADDINDIAHIIAMTMLTG